MAQFFSLVQLFRRRFMLTCGLMLCSLFSLSLALAGNAGKQADAALLVTIKSVTVGSQPLDLLALVGVTQIIPLPGGATNVSIELGLDATGDQAKTAVFEYRVMSGPAPKFHALRDNIIHFVHLPLGQLPLEIRAKSLTTGQYSPAALVQLQVGYFAWLSSDDMLIILILVLILIFIWLLYRFNQGRRSKRAMTRLKNNESRLQMALRASNSDAWDWRADDNMLWGQRMVSDLGYPKDKLHYHYDEHLSCIHPDDRADFNEKWLSFLDNGTLTSTFYCLYRLKSQTGQWLWYKDVAKIVELSTSGQAKRVCGSYTLVDQDEYCQDTYFGSAFQSTKDWVLVANRDANTITANASACKAFGWPEASFEISAKNFGITQSRLEFYLNLVQTFKRDQHWRGDELIRNARGDQYHVMINLSTAYNHLCGTLQYIFVVTDITKQKQQEQQLRYLANYDQLTELPNRSLLLDRVKHALDHSNRKQTSIAVFFIDLNKFKQINDTLGHEYGDLMLQQVAKRLTAVLRLDDTVARLGGDEFVILLESFRSNDHLSHIADKVLNALAPEFLLNDKPVNIGASIGIALYPEDAGDSDELLRHADVAMYHAKRQGQGGFQFFTQHMNDEALRRKQQGIQLKNAIARHEFINYYVPITDGVNDNIVGVEVLIYWQYEQELLAPQQFMPFAKILGLTTSITEHALTQAFLDLKDWQQRRREFFISVNFSAQHLGKASLLTDIASLLSINKLTPSSLRVELSEDVLLWHKDQAKSLLSGLVALGVAPVLDDFGTDHISLNFLSQLPLQGIKLAPGLIKDLGNERRHHACLGAALTLAQEMQMPIIAQGVHTTHQRYYLLARQCYLWQADPMRRLRAKEIQAMLTTAANV